MMHQLVLANSFPKKLAFIVATGFTAAALLAFGMINSADAAEKSQPVVSLKGEVTQVKPNHLTVQYEGTAPDGTHMMVKRTFNVGSADMPAHMLQPGSQVQVWFWWGTNTATRVKDRAPADLISVWGAVDGRV